MNHINWVKSELQSAAHPAGEDKNGVSEKEHVAAI